MEYEGAEYSLNLKDNFSGPLKEAETHAHGFHESVLHIVEALGLVEAAKEVFAFFKESLGEYQQHSTAVASLTQMYKNNSDSVGVSLDKLKEMSEEQEKLTGINSESTLAAEQNLMKFREIKISYEDLIPVIGDFAAATKTDSAEAANTLGRALENPAHAMRLLMQAGVSPEAIASIQNLQKMGKSAQAQQEIFEALKDKYHGVAKAMFDDNPSAQIEIQMKELKEEIGQVEQKFLKALMPAIKSVFEGLKHLMEFLKEHKETIIAIAKVVGTLAVAMVGYKLTVMALEAPMAIATIAQTAWNAAMEANPIGLVVAGVIALIAALMHLEGVYNDIIKSVTDNRQKGMKEEINTVGQLAGQYKNLTKEQAINAAITAERSKLVAQFAENEKAIKNVGSFDKGGMEKLAAERDRITGQMAALNDPDFIKKQLAERDKLASTTKHTSVLLPPKSEKVGGTSHVTINVTIQKMIGIDKMVTTNFKEGAQKAGEIVERFLTAGINQFQANIDS